MNERILQSGRKVVDCNRCRKMVDLDSAFLIEATAHDSRVIGAPPGYPKFESHYSIVSADLCVSCHTLISRAIATVMGGA